MTSLSIRQLVDKILENKIIPSHYIIKTFKRTNDEFYVIEYKYCDRWYQALEGTRSDFITEYREILLKEILDV